MRHWTDVLKRIRACGEAITWARDYDSLEDAWKACERPDWMLWYAGRIAGPPESKSRQKLVLAACACARTALPYASGDAAKNAIETAERWANDDEGVTLQDVRAAADAAIETAERWANGAAAAAAYAAYAVYADAADDAAAAADDADDAARKKALIKMAHIVREYYPIPPRKGEN